MHSPLEIARNYIEVGIHKVNLSIFKTILLGFFAGMFIGFAGIASTTASSTIGIEMCIRDSTEIHICDTVLEAA